MNCMTHIIIFLSWTHTTPSVYASKRLISVLGMPMPDGTISSSSCVWFWLVGHKSKAFDASLPEWMRRDDIALLQQHLEQLDLDLDWHDADVGALGLICVQVGRFIDRALGDLDLRPTERIVLRFWERHADLWGCDFADVLCLPVVRAISFEQIQPSILARVPRRSFEFLEEGVPQLYGSQPSALGQGTMLQVSGLDSVPALALCMPSVFASLLMNEKLDRIILPWASSRRSRLFKVARVHPSAEAMLLPQQLPGPIDRPSPVEDDFDVSEKLDFAVMAKCLRRVVDKNDVSLPAADRLLYTKVISQLERLQTSALRRADVIELNENKWQYQMVHMLKAIFISLEMNDVYDFKSLTLRCLQLTVQPQLFEMLKRFLEEQEEGVLPQRSMLYAHRLSLDVGWMLAQREINSQRFTPGSYATFFALDKSPQGKLDYLMGQCLRVRDDDLAQVYDSVCSLALDMRERSLTNKQRIDYIMFCCKMLTQHVLTPVVVGSGNSGASACLKAWVWSLFLEGGKVGSAADLSAMAALTSDFGEASLTTFGPVNGYTLFPWMQPTNPHQREPSSGQYIADPIAAREGDDDEDGEFDFAEMPGLIHYNPDCDDNDPAADQEAPLVPLDIESESDRESTCFDFVADPTSVAPDPSSFDPCDDNSSSEDWQFDMSGCLHVPGRCFVVPTTTSPTTTT